MFIIIISNFIFIGTPINEGRYIATSSSSTSSGVVSGGRNVPFSLSFNNISPSSDGSEEGMFVQRTEEELIIEQVFIFYFFNFLHLYLFLY